MNVARPALLGPRLTQGSALVVCSAVFFVSYCVFEVPSNMALKKVRPNLWLAFIVSILGIIMLSMAFVKNYKQLAVARFFLGVTEAGLLPGATFYLSQCASTLAEAFGGILAFAIQKIEGWIFLLATVVIAFSGFSFMPDYPEKARFLTSAERDYLLDLLAKDSAGLSKKFELKFFWQALGDYNLWLMSTPPYVFACLVVVIITRLSDKTKMRGPFILGIAIVGIIGYTIWYTTKSATAGYIAAFFACSRMFGKIAVVLSWAGSNTGGDMNRSVVLAMVIGLGNLGGFVTALFMTWNYRRLNAIKDKDMADKKDTDTLADMGDASPHYR
ncbi:major facilitator superfamily domain-containing protein [Mycena epipterygia]|nr:major facilitator superfamily domain-containing protein [Mycena epipterygia]